MYFELFWPIYKSNAAFEHNVNFELFRPAYKNSQYSENPNKTVEMQIMLIT